MTLQELKDAMAVAAFDMTIQQAHDKGVCISCKKEITKLVYDLREYQISGLCDPCFNFACGPEEE